jgi:hypothetical protein
MLCERAGETDVVKVLDFGIAKILADDDSQDQRKALTKTGMVFGTPQYMSPEQIRGEKVDHRSDIYSLGVILYQMLTGNLPFNAETPMGLLTKHLMDVPPALEPQGIPASVAGVVMSTLEKDASKRPQSMRELGLKLSQAAGLNAAGTAPQPVVASSAKTVPQQAVSQAASNTPKSAKKSDVGYSSGPSQKKAFPIVPVMAAAILLAGGGAAAWYFTAGPGGRPSVPEMPPTIAAGPPQIPASIAQYGQQQPGISTAVPTVPVAGQPSVLPPSVAPLPSTPTIETPPDGKSSDKDSSSNSGKKPPKTDKTPTNDGIPTVPGKIPNEGKKCNITSGTSEVAKSVKGAIKENETAFKGCSVSNPNIDVAFSYKVAKGGTKVTTVSPTKGSNPCVKKLFEKISFAATSEAGEGNATFKITAVNGEVSNCSILVSTKKAQEDKPGDKPEAKPDNKPDNTQPVKLPDNVTDKIHNLLKKPGSGKKSP